MSFDGGQKSEALDVRPEQAIGPRTYRAGVPTYLTHRLRSSPNSDHRPENYEELELEFSPSLFSSIERYLPPNLLQQSRQVKVDYMRDILLQYYSEDERIRLQKHREYRQKIISNYPSLHLELYNMHPTNFFVPSFLKAINENTEQAFRNIMLEPSPGIFTFEMLQPRFCEMLLAEVEHFEKWVREIKFRIMRPNTMNKYGAVLDDFGLKTMLGKLMEDFIRPISKVFFPEVGGSNLDSHHGFVLEYGIDRDVDLGFHVDDSEVTLNACLGKQFSGGELFFRVVRCEEHVNTETKSEEIFDYSHVPGHAVLHRGRHRHGARATTSGNRVNLLLWCRSSVFRESRKYQKDFSSWCPEFAAPDASVLADSSSPLLREDCDKTVDLPPVQSVEPLVFENDDLLDDEVLAHFTSKLTKNQKKKAKAKNKKTSALAQPKDSVGKKPSNGNVKPAARPLLQPQAVFTQGGGATLGSAQPPVSIPFSSTAGQKLEELPAQSDPLQAVPRSAVRVSASLTASSRASLSESASSLDSDFTEFVHPGTNTTYTIPVHLIEGINDGLQDGSLLLADIDDYIAAKFQQVDTSPSASFPLSENSFATLARPPAQSSSLGQKKVGKYVPPPKQGAKARW